MPAKRKPRSLVARAFGGKYGRLLIALSALMVASPLITLGRGWGIVIGACASITLLTAIYAISPVRRSIWIGLVVALADMTLGQISVFASNPGWLFAQALLSLSILVYTAAALLRSILDGGRVTDETLQGAMCGYLLLGLIGTYVYVVIQMAFPGSLNIHDLEFSSPPTYHEMKEQFLRLLYFSFTTLTTLGLGDITPKSGFAKMAVCIEAVTGQVYLAILIARLVGMHIAQGPADKK